MKIPAIRKLVSAWPGVSDKSQLYNLDAVAYESVMLGLFSIWPGKPSDRPKPNHLCVGFSRDGFSWVRPTRGGGPNAFIPAANDTDSWNAFNVARTIASCLALLALVPAIALHGRVTKALKTDVS